MFSYNNKMHLTQSSAILQQKQQLFSSYDLSAMGSELTSIISSQEDTFKPTLYDSNGSYYQMGLNTDFFNGEQIWQPLTVNSNSFASFSQTESFSRAASSPKEPFRAIIKKSNTSVHKNETNPAIPMCPRPKESEDKPKLVDDKPKFVKKVDKAPSCLRQLPIRSQNIDMSQFLKKADSFSSIGSISCVSPSSSSMSDSFSTASPPLCSPTRVVNKSVKNMQVKCSFCENNGESEEIYMSHPLKDSLSRVVCPILRNFECPKCHEKGDYAHTNKYCPETQRKRKENKIKSILSTSD